MTIAHVRWIFAGGLILIVLDHLWAWRRRRRVVRAFEHALREKDPR